MLGIWLQTIFGFRSYHRLHQAKRWQVALFVIYLAAIGILTFNLYIAWCLHKDLPAFIRQFPTITLEKGRLTEPKRPITVDVPHTQYHIVLDASAESVPSHAKFLADKIMIFVSQDRFYMPSVTSVNSQPIPTQADGTFDQARLQQYLPALRTFIQTVAFVGSFFALAMFFFFSVLLAAGVVFFWRTLTRSQVPAAALRRWAVFLQGPALVLWIIHLIWGVPLFPFALFVLFNIYVQQIFNTLPQK